MFNIGKNRTICVGDVVNSLEVGEEVDIFNSNSNDECIKSTTIIAIEHNKKFKI